MNYILQANALEMLADSRRKRQVSATSSNICEPRFIPLKDSSTRFKLIWACPDNITPPSIREAEELICTTLLDENIIIDCTYSNGESALTPVQMLDPIT